jgi:predicted naringenin-chalcone synthase
MGCAAAMNGLRIASDYATQHPGRASLMVAVEISSVHGSFADNMNDIIIHSLFGDGCAAVVVTADDDVDTLGRMYGRFLSNQPITSQIENSSPNLQITVDATASSSSAVVLSPAHKTIVDSFVRDVTAHQKSNSVGPLGPQMHVIDAMSWLVDGTDDGIVLNILNDGITCTLSRDLPDYIMKSLHIYVDGILARNGLTRADVDYWAVHPGGTRIIGAAMESLGLTEEQTKWSWGVLRDYGNMLSPSILFVLERISNHLKQQQADESQITVPGGKDSQLIIAFSFSPGVGIEGCLIRVTL